MEVKNFIPWGEYIPIELMSEKYNNDVELLYRIEKVIQNDIINHNNNYLEIDDDGNINLEESKNLVKEIFTLGMYIPEEIVEKMNLDIHLEEPSGDMIFMDWYDKIERAINGEMSVIALGPINWSPVIRWSNIYQVIDINSEYYESLFWETSGDCISENEEDIESVLMY